MPDFTEQQKTLENCIGLLNKYNKCFLIRPTGFGKTYILTELARRFENVLYLYPSQVVKDTVVNRYFELPDQDPEGPINPETIQAMQAIGEIPGCTLMTYAKIARMVPDKFKELDFSLVISDEAHRMGGPKTKLACDRLFAVLPSSTKFIGATATPTRPDNFDVSSHFYSDRLCYPYTLHDAITSGMIQKPNYCYATYDFKKDLEDAAKEAGEDLADDILQQAISAKAIELADIFGLPKIIRETCDKYAIRTDYLKFIVFFASRKHMLEKCNDVQSWFQEAYPGHQVQVLKITSLDPEERSNTDKLPYLTPQPNKIDLIACIDMLNLGYHVNDQTGIVMYRGTQSGIVFTQQLGRALSAGSGCSGIVFDIVDNLHRKAVYQISAKDVPGPSMRKRRAAEPMLDNYWLDEASGLIFTGTKEDPMPTQYHYDGTSIKDKSGHRACFKLDAHGCVKNTSDAMSDDKDINKITPDCLNATGHDASYREVLKKAVAEPLAHRCKYAVQLHLRSWCRAKGVRYPVTEKQLSRLYGLDIQDFHKELMKVIQSNKLSYPLHDASELLKPDKDSNVPPLAVCCKAVDIDVDTLVGFLFP